jgi:hypothetical protein
LSFLALVAFQVVSGLGVLVGEFMLAFNPKQWGDPA